MRIYAVSLEKGGVGKTSVAVNLAATFAQTGLRTLLIDLDAQAHATQWLGVNEADITPDQTVLAATQGRHLLQCIRPTADLVDLIPAHPSMVGLPAMLLTAPNNGLFVLRHALARLAQERPYEVVLLDLAPARSTVLATALAAASRVLAPVQAEDLVLQSLRALVDSVEQARPLNPGLRGVSVIRNRYAVRGTVDTAYDEALRSTYGPLLLRTVIPIRASLRHAAGARASVFRYSSPDASEVRGLFIDLATELIELDEVA
jgi:chromosome partitioning protein